MGIKRFFGALFNAGRISQRVDGAAATVHIDGAAHAVIDWNESGLRVESYDDAPPVGERFAFRFELPLTSDDLFEFEAVAEVLDNSSRGISARFVLIEDELAARLHAVVRVLGTIDVAVPKGAVDYN
jgi:hypothetical protein